MAAAFISYAHRYKTWVVVLHRNLERCLRGRGEEWQVFLDQVDLGSGRSWVLRLQELLARAEHLVLVATPEALASPRVSDEWQAFITRNRHWQQGRLHVLRLVDCPLPPFLELVQHLDLREHTAATYRQELARLVAGLCGHADYRDLPELPDDIVIPPTPAPVLPATLRRRLVDWLVPVMEHRVFRRNAATAFGLERNALDGHPTPSCAASAAIVAATAADDHVAAALRIAGTMAAELEEDESGRRAALQALRQEITSLQQRGGDEPGLLGNWLDSLAGHPVVDVTWFEAVAFCRWLSATLPDLEGARLPTEEEWEYACRAGTETRYWSGDSEADLARVGWYDENSGKRTHRVGEKQANPWGLCDTHGNVWEWTLSEFTQDYSSCEDGIELEPSAVRTADLAASSGARRVVRGGGCWNSAGGARAACRFRRLPAIVYRDQGFRVVVPVAPE